MDKAKYYKNVTLKTPKTSDINMKKKYLLASTLEDKTKGNSLAYKR